MGTLGGYVMVYDIRYSVTSSMYRHNMNYPILSLAACNAKRQSGTVPTVLISAGAPNLEVS